MKDNDDIEEKANNIVNSLFVDIFPENDLKIIKHESGRNEIGVDYSYDVFDKSSQSQVLFFRTQNKGTNDKLKIIKTKRHPEFGKISFQLDLRHAKQYYLEMREPILFVICDINNDKAYWYPIQTDNGIKKKIKDKEKNAPFKSKPTIQIYIPFENEINNENFKKLIEDINSSSEEQTRKHSSNISFESDYSNIKSKIADKHIIDKLSAVIYQFDELKNLPNSIITNLPVFKEENKSTWIHDFSLNIENEEMYNLFSNLKLKDNRYLFSKGDVVENQNAKLASIVKFFKNNYIYFVSFNVRKKRINISLRELFLDEKCSCSRCSFVELNFKKTEHLLNKHSNKDSLYEQLRRGYAGYLIGNLSLAATIFFEVKAKAFETKSFLLYFIALNNLLRIKNLMKWNYYAGDKSQFNLLLDNENLDTNFNHIKKNSPHLIDVINWVKEDKFYKNNISNIDNLLEESKKMWYYDKHGSYYQNDKVTDLISSFLKFYSFIEFNCIIYDCYQEFKGYSLKVFETTLALYGIKNSKSSKHEKIDFSIIKIWLFYVKYDKAKELLNKYDIKVIEVNAVYENLYNYLENLFISKETLKRDGRAYYFNDKLELILKNTTLLLSRLNLSKRKLNIILTKILIFLKEAKYKSLLPFDGLKQILLRKEVTKKNSLLILNLFLNNDRIDSLVIRVYLKTANEEELKKLVFKILEVKNINEDNIFKNKNFTKIGEAISKLNTDLKKELKSIIFSTLKKDFNHSLFYISAIYDLIEFDEILFDKYLNTIPDKSKVKHSLFGISDNHRLAEAVNLMFKLQLPFTDKIKKYIEFCSKEESCYFEWLMDIDNFDYSKFDIYWVLRNRTKFYIREFKKSEKLIKVVKTSLKENYILGVAQLYINDLT